jgi:hypothetical protein
MAKHDVLLLAETLTARRHVRPFERLLSVECIRDQCLSEIFYHGDMKRAEEQQQRCQLDFDVAIANTLDNQQTLPFDQKLTSSMCELIQKRLANISDRLACEYKFKIELFRLSLTTY